MKSQDIVTDLRLRKLELSDLNEIFRLENRDDVMKFTGPGRALDFEESKSRLIEKLSMNHNHDFLGFYGFFNEKKLVVWLMLVEIEEKINLGYMTNPDYWGKGLSRKLISHFFSKIPENILKKGIYASVEQKNIASIKIINRLGFKEISREKLKEKDDFLINYYLK